LRWGSFVVRFLRQTFFVQLRAALAEWRRTQIHLRNHYHEIWHELVPNFVHSRQIHSLQKAARHLNQMKAHWWWIISIVMRNYRVRVLESEYSHWMSLRMRTDTEMVAFWKRGSRMLLRNYRIFEHLRKSMALQTLSRFARYIIFPIRARVVAWEFEPNLKSFGREITREIVIQSAARIRTAAREGVRRACERFASDFNSAIATVFCSFAHTRLVPEDQMPPLVKPTFPAIYAEPEPETSSSDSESLSTPARTVSIPARRWDECPDIEDDIESIAYGNKVIHIERDYSRSDSIAEIVHEPVDLVFHGSASRSDLEEPYLPPPERPPLDLSMPVHREQFSKPMIPDARIPRVVPEGSKETVPRPRRSSSERDLSELNWRFDSAPSSASHIEEDTPQPIIEEEEEEADSAAPNVPPVALDVPEEQNESATPPAKPMVSEEEEDEKPNFDFSDGRDDS
jgi:hypothetical protein